MKRRIAVIGLGIMGHAMADNFLKNGYEVWVWNRSPRKADDLKGAKLAGSPKQAAANADIVFEVTANDESSRQVWLGEDGILSGGGPEKYLVASPTLSVDWVDELAAKCREQGLTFFDMPLTGGRKAAEAGKLVLLVGGDKAKLDEIAADLKAIARSIKYFGPAGSGTKYKLILNTLQGTILVAFGEAMRMAAEAGLDQKIVGEALTEAPGGYTVEVAHNSYQNDPKPINFSLAWEDKDLNYAKRMAAKGDYPVRDEVIEKFDQALKNGHGDNDWSAVNKL
ncbi:MAG TPA: NAD(P)-dependent oxidoreductase [Candidatus Saccharimonadales bacterium]|nr:NAD(P)-dependent oxidoreductase [Candidatus Saccharimonadales bacterium]